MDRQVVKAAALLIVALILISTLGLALSSKAAPAGHGSKVSITGRVSAIAEEAEEGRFAIIGENNTVTIDVSRWDYMIDYLTASNGRVVTLTLEPK